MTPEPFQFEDEQKDYDRRCRPECWRKQSHGELRAQRTKRQDGNKRLHRRVRDVANSLGYRANAIAKSLSTRRTDTLAVLFQSGAYFSAWSGFTSEVMRGVSEACYEEGFDLMLHTKPAATTDEEAAALNDGRVDGVLILRDEDDETFLKLVEQKLPCVQFFTHSDRQDVPSVDCNNVLGGYLATTHLINQGHRRIAMFSGGHRSVSSNERVAGYRQALEEAGIDCNPDWIIPTSDRQSDLDQVLRLMQETHGPSALFVWSDDTAVTLMRDMRREGIRIPDEISIVGYDSLASAEMSEPPLTSVRQPVRQMAAEATRMLIQIVRGGNVPIRQILFDPVLDVRSSTSLARDGKISAYSI